LLNFVRLDNASENKTFQQEAENDPELKLTCEFTAPYTPQQNGKIERKFTTLWGKVRTMLIAAKLTWILWHKLWAQSANLATQF
jgi:transposase InsO family protein